MISNPVIAKKSGGGQVFSITDNLGVGFPSSAEAGELVKSTTLVNGLYSITDSDGNPIPHGTIDVESRAWVPSIAVDYFVMPASDVTIN